MLTNLNIFASSWFASIKGSTDDCYKQIISNKNDEQQLRLDQWELRIGDKMTNHRLENFFHSFITIP